ncbi:MAG: tRNA pseudouridine(55) synthase TruB [Deltaproteobacteria bacterium]|nr:tRNA pseudouridine(55) synthase TruB [Deltaproteobacteria bacterium]MBW2219103.1 tRNA pseudouridine(55) synthase TruB [Deltaproteobacteria bacterium]
MQSEENGIIIIDKPAGTTSAKVVARLKKITGALKAGHTGTLDPLATGVMVCCINRATRLARFFLAGDKKYKAVLYLGKETDTQDATGKTTAVCDSIELTSQRIREVFKEFEGSMAQAPPVFSSLKHKGVPLYKLARQGKPIQKPPRQILIHYLKISDIDIPKIHFEVSCSSGTYIRTLCADIGKRLGCGGHLKSLRRIESCGFSINQACDLQEVEMLSTSGMLSERIISMANAVIGMAGYISDTNLSEKIIAGRKITAKDLENMPFIEKKSSAFKNFIKIIGKENNLLAVLENTGETEQYDYCCVFPKNLL